MGINTMGIITKGTTLDQILGRVKEVASSVADSPFSSSSENYFMINFVFEGEQRTMSVFTGSVALNDYKIDGVLIDLGYSGIAPKLIRGLVSYFGGYYKENDCDDKDWTPINIDLFEQGKEFSNLDLFKNKVIRKLGYQNLDTAIALFEEFKTL